MTQRYEAKGKIGQGGLGEVYLAYDTQLDREVALKRVKPQEAGEAGMQALSADLIREARTLSALQHPNIVTIYDVGSDDKGPFVIMEYLKGETLDQVIERGKLSVDDFREVVLQVMEGMVAAQAMGLVHRDLKPGNLMVNWLPSGKFQVKILDFGLAKFSRSAVPQTQDQGDGIMGSIFFMAPEQFERLPLDSRTDLYSLGCIFYQILTQKHPFDGNTPVDVMVSHLQHLVNPLHELRKDIPAWMADWVMWLISREMDDRPADARTALDHFQAQKSGLPASAAPAAAAAAKTAPVKVVGRAPAPARAVPTPKPSARKETATATQPVKSGSSTQQMRGGSHSTAVSSRPLPRKVGKKLSFRWVSVLTGTIVVGAGLGIFYYIYKDGTKPKPNPRAVLETLQGAAPEGGPETARELVALAALGGDNAKDALAAMLRVRGKGVAQVFAEELAKAKPPLQDLLIQVVGVQASPEGTAALWKLAQSQTGDVQKNALAALAQCGTPGDIAEFIKGAGKFSTAETRKDFFKLIERLLAKQTDRDGRVDVLAPALAAADAATRPAVYRLLGASGSAEASRVLAAEIAAGGDRQRSAIDALHAWAGVDVRLADALLDAAKSGDRDLLVPAYCRTLTRIASLTAAEVVDGLKRAVPLADTPKARSEFATVLGTLATPEALAFAQELAGGPNAALAEAVKPAPGAITKQLASALKLIKGENILEPENVIVLSPEKDAYYSSTVRYVAGWRSPQARLAWDIVVPSAMSVEVEIEQSALRSEHSYFVSLGAESVEKSVTVTKNSDDFVRVETGKFSLPKAGHWRLIIEAGRSTDNEALMNVRRIIVRMP